jgi:diacylglycerol kinase family enzyme
MSIDLEIEWFLNNATGGILSEHIQRYQGDGLGGMLNVEW